MDFDYERKGKKVVFTLVEGIDGDGTFVYTNSQRRERWGGLVTIQRPNIILRRRGGWVNTGVDLEFFNHALSDLARELDIEVNQADWFVRHARYLPIRN